MRGGGVSSESSEGGSDSASVSSIASPLSIDAAACRVGNQLRTLVKKLPPTFPLPLPLPPLPLPELPLVNSSLPRPAAGVLLSGRRTKCSVSRVSLDLARVRLYTCRSSSGPPALLGELRLLRGITSTFTTVQSQRVNPRKATKPRQRKAVVALPRKQKTSFRVQQQTELFRCDRYR